MSLNEIQQLMQLTPESHCTQPRNSQAKLICYRLKLILATKKSDITLLNQLMATVTPTNVYGQKC